MFRFELTVASCWQRELNAAYYHEVLRILKLADPLIPLSADHITSRMDFKGRVN